MSIKILSAIVLAFITLNLVSCSEDPSSIGSALLSRDFIKLDSLDSFKDTLPQTSSTYKRVFPLGFSSTLLLGKTAANEATMLLSFNIVVPDSIKTDLFNNLITVSSATVQLYKDYTFGDSTQPFDYTVHSISSNWTSTGFTYDSLALLQSDPTDVSSNKTSSDTLFQFNITPALALKWLSIYADSLTPDNGIVVRPTSGSNKIVGFYALTSATTVNIPFLVVVLNKPGFYSNDTLKFSTTADLSVISGDKPSLNPPEDIFVQSSIELESRIQFDVSKLPQHAIINYAELQLSLDSTNSVFGTPYTDQLVAFYITDSLHIDSLSTSQVVLNRVGSLYTGNITSYVQTWLSTKINEGIQIRASVYDTGLEKWALKGSNAADRSLRPRLKIIYTNNK